MVQIKSYKASIIIKSALLTISIFILSALIGRVLAYKGLALGVIIAGLNFHFLTCDIAKIQVLDKKSYQSVLIIRYLMRYGMIALAMMCVVRYDLGIVAFLIGFFSLQSVLFIENIKMKASPDS